MYRKSFPNKQSDADHGNQDGCQLITPKRGNSSNSLDFKGVYSLYRFTENLGEEWLRDSIMPDGVFSEPILRKTRDIITFAHRKLQQSHSYTHPKLLAEMEFGIWKYMFSPIQYRVTGRNLLSIFPNKPRSSREMQYNQTYIFNELDKVNSLRNRIAHHETICFANNTSTIDTSYVINIYVSCPALGCTHEKSVGGMPPTLWMSTRLRLRVWRVSAKSERESIRKAVLSARSGWTSPGGRLYLQAQRSWIFAFFALLGITGA